MVYFKLKKTTPVNYYGIAKLPTFRNGDVAITAGIMTAIDRCPEEVKYTEPTPKIEDHRGHGQTVAFSDTVGYEQGNLVIPEHNIKSGKMWYYVQGSCTTVSATYETHTLYEADPPFLGIAAEMEHATTAYNKIVDLLGVTIETAVFTFGQTQPVTHSFSGKVAKSITGNNLARTSALDYKKNFLPGKFSYVLEYAGTDLNFTIRGGTITETLTWDYGRGSDTLVTEANLISRDYELNLDGLPSPATSYNLFTVPTEPIDYSSNKITLDLKVYRSATSDIMRWSFTNLWLEPVMGAKIAEADYYYRTNIILHNCGARASVSQGKAILTITDDLTKNHFER